MGKRDEEAVAGMSDRRKMLIAVLVLIVVGVAVFQVNRKEQSDQQITAGQELARQVQVLAGEISKLEQNIAGLEKKDEYTRPRTASELRRELTGIGPPNEVASPPSQPSGHDQGLVEISRQIQELNNNVQQGFGKVQADVADFGNRVIEIEKGLKFVTDPIPSSDDLDDEPELESID